MCRRAARDWQDTDGILTSSNSTTYCSRLQPKIQYTAQASSLHQRNGFSNRHLGACIQHAKLQISMLPRNIVLADNTPYALSQCTATINSTTHVCTPLAPRQHCSTNAQPTISATDVAQYQ